MDFDIIKNGLKKGFDVWKNNAVAYIVGLIIVGIVIAIVGGLGGVSIIPAIASRSLAGMGLSVIGLIIAAIVLFVVGAPLIFGLFYMSVKGARGDKVEIKDVFYAFGSTNLIIRSVIYIFIFGLIAGILTIIPILGQILLLVVNILLLYAAYIYIMTPSENFVYAFKESYNIAKENLAITIVAFLVYAVLIMIGLILFGIGLIVTLPIATIFTVAVLKELKPDIKDNTDNA